MRVPCSCIAHGLPSGASFETLDRKGLYSKNTVSISLRVGWKGVQKTHFGGWLLPPPRTHFSRGADRFSPSPNVGRPFFCVARNRFVDETGLLTPTAGLNFRYQVGNFSLMGGALPDQGAVHELGAD